MRLTTRMVLFLIVSFFTILVYASVRILVPQTGWVQLATDGFTMQNLSSSTMYVQPSAGDPGIADTGTNAFQIAPNSFFNQNLVGTGPWWARATQEFAAVIVEDF